jgi:hypothetical protein
MSDDYLSGLSHAKLYSMRDQSNDPVVQAQLAPYEHRAFAREVIAENPLMAIPVGAAIPLYDAAKALGYGDARSPASWDSLVQGLKGWQEGYSQANPPVQVPGLLGSLYDQSK